MSNVWYYSAGSDVVGPISLADLGAILSRVSNAKEVLVWRNGFDTWVKAEDANELVPFLVSPPPLPVTTAKPAAAELKQIRFNWGVMATLLACALWIALDFYLYAYMQVLRWPILALCALVTAAFLWTKRRNSAMGVAIGTAVGFLMLPPIMEYQFDSENAVIQGFSSVSDLREAEGLGLTAQQLADRRAQEAARAAEDERWKREADAAKNACQQNWSKCSDNAAIANNYSRWSDVKYACEREATARAKYGEPVWPSYPFGSFFPGNDVVKTGIAFVVEPDAQFQNGFGAKVHSRVVCKYDLHADNVIDVVIVPR